MKGSRLGSNLLEPDDDSDSLDLNQEESSKLVNMGNDRTKGAGEDEESSEDEFGLKDDPDLDKAKNVGAQVKGQDNEDDDDDFFDNDDEDASVASKANQKSSSVVTLPQLSANKLSRETISSSVAAPKAGPAKRSPVQAKEESKENADASSSDFKKLMSLTLEQQKKKN